MQRRTIRILSLLIAILIFNIGDLVMTLAYKESGMMIENNVVAAGIVHNDSVAALILFKSSLIFIGFAILWTCRKQTSSEIGCWLMLAVLTLLTLKWSEYIDAINLLHRYSPSDPQQQQDLIEQIRRGDISDHLTGDFQ